MSISVYISAYRTSGCVVQAAGRVTFRVNFNVRNYIAALCGTDGGLCHFSCQFQGTVLETLCGTDGGSCQFSCTFQLAVLTALCGADGSVKHIVSLPTQPATIHLVSC